jgi:hypothetical protein
MFHGGCAKIGIERGRTRGHPPALLDHTATRAILTLRRAAFDSVRLAAFAPGRPQFARGFPMEKGHRHV